MSRLQDIPPSGSFNAWSQGFEFPDLLLAICKREQSGELKFKWLEKTAEEWFHHAQEWRFPFSPVQTMAGISDSVQLRDRGYFVEFPHPAVGALRYPGAPFRMSETPRRQSRPAPTLGEHNLEVFAELGYEDGVITP